jgi:V/A-type H+-transporting ATPase subunit B
MNSGIGEGKTRADHWAVADQLYALYAQGRDLRRLVAIIGESALSSDDRRVLDFADKFERTFVGQGFVDRDIDETLAVAWEMLSQIPSRLLKRIPQDFINKHYGRD